jgi:hypothetical protein
MNNDNKPLRTKIVNHVKKHGRITVSEAKGIIRSAYSCEIEEAYESHMATFVRNALASIRDEEGMRTTFSVIDDSGNRVYIDVDTCKDSELVNRVLKQLKTKKNGLLKSMKKCKKRMHVLDGQISMEI